jgi:hypothetical protein
MSIPGTMSADITTIGETVSSAAGDSQAPYFAVSLLKLTVMSVCTFGIYELYWFYKNWRLIMEREKIDI